MLVRFWGTRGSLPVAQKAGAIQGKIAAARWFARTTLPKLTAERAIAEGTDNAVMDLPESSF